MKFIWLDNNKFPNYQKTFYTDFCDKTGFSFAVVGFRKKLVFENTVSAVNVSLFADTKYKIFINGKFVGRGPVVSGGDYSYDKPMPYQYYSCFETIAHGHNLDIYVQVQLSPDKQCFTSCGQGCLWLEYEVVFEDGKVERFCADETWFARLEPAFISPTIFDFTKIPLKWEQAALVKPVLNLKKSPICNLTEEYILPIKTSFSNDKTTAEFDKIYSGYFSFSVRTDGDFSIEVKTLETTEKVSGIYKINGCGNTKIDSIFMNSIGFIEISVLNGNINIDELALVFTHYPIKLEGSFKCDDDVLNSIYEVGKHTVNICRQSLELDSPLHLENLGCVGDYLIESLVSYCCFGDASLTEFDIVRIADYMRETKGVMFHTSYSLMWIYMLWDYYVYCGDKTIFERHCDVIDILLDRFHSYADENEIIDNPPNYMFVDWIPVDDYNLHHPPKSLGQTVLTAFYYHALCVSQKIYAILNDSKKAKILSDRAVKLKNNFNKYFFDTKTNLYFCGLNDKDDGEEWRPKNSDKRYFSKHANILAVLFELADDGKAVMEQVVTNNCLIDVQPYFMHFLLEALYKCGLFEKYGLAEIKKWEKQIAECQKGMKEAWGNYPGYDFDYSHGWGASPSYHLPMKILGLTILEPGFKKIALKPNLFGLKFANITIPTPFGLIKCRLGDNEFLQVPPEIAIC